MHNIDIDQSENMMKETFSLLLNAWMVFMFKMSSIRFYIEQNVDD